MKVAFSAASSSPFVVAGVFDDSHSNRGELES
jgi:hypothetical protein